MQLKKVQEAPSGVIFKQWDIDRLLLHVITMIYYAIDGSKTMLIACCYHTHHMPSMTTPRCFEAEELCKKLEDEADPTKLLEQTEERWDGQLGVRAVAGVGWSVWHKDMSRKNDAKQNPPKFTTKYMI